ncbi:MAG: hypothetical protein JW779_00900, partial [Candidatus Thorarchaeota archaeon]|nr:hypothetical protein [Candidatus Thorarchaeota archaeon]
MNEENESGSWMLKGIIVLFLTIFPTAGVFVVLMLIPWMPLEWYGPTLLLSGLTFLIGGGILLENKEVKLWLYSLLVGLLIGVGSIILATLHLLSTIPIPIFGNAFYAAMAGLAGVGFLFLLYWTTNQSATQTSLVASSNKSFVESRQIFQSHFLQNRPDEVLAIEVIEVPHDHIFVEEGVSPTVSIERFYSIIRTLFSTPFAIRYQRVHGTTRIFFLTWS